VHRNRINKSKYEFIIRNPAHGVLRLHCQSCCLPRRREGPADEASRAPGDHVCAWSERRSGGLTLAYAVTAPDHVYGSLAEQNSSSAHLLFNNPPRDLATRLQSKPGLRLNQLFGAELCINEGHHMNAQRRTPKQRRPLSARQHVRADHAQPAAGAEGGRGPARLGKGLRGRGPRAHGARAPSDAACWVTTWREGAEHRGRCGVLYLPASDAFGFSVGASDDGAQISSGHTDFRFSRCRRNHRA